uniref:DNA/RNA non-specific endonuclease/pyrophosphatase/phosphodiesterase domain-containing protein n=1 Tax=Salmo trutta TaxID=8032 RepID=A0A674B9B6_SALTR
GDERRMPVSCRGALLLLLASLGGLLWGEVGDFTPCLWFFYMKTPPTAVGGEGYQPICQRYRNQYHFASLYQCQSSAPLYSSYILTPGGGKRPRNKWMYEPQLAFSSTSPEMHCFPRHGPVDQNVVESQVVLQDYTSSSYTKGPEDHRATYTLSNVVPQRLEVEMRARMGDYCMGPAFVVTLPYLSECWMANRVAVPEYMWSAYCCPSENSSLPARDPTFHHIPLWVRTTLRVEGRLDRWTPRRKASVRGYDVKRLPLDTVETILQHPHQPVSHPMSMSRYVSKIV